MQGVPVRKMIKNTASFVFEKTALPLFRKRGNSKAIVLMYHRVCPDDGLDTNQIVHPDIFEEQIKYLKQHYTVLSADKLYRAVSKKSIPRNSVIITFDDGYLDNYTYAYPILKKHCLKAIIFIAPKFIEQNTKLAWWDKAAFLNKCHGAKTDISSLKIMDSRQREKYLAGFKKKFPSQQIFLDWKKIAEMQDVFDVASHTYSHPVLTNEPQEVIDSEISKAKSIIVKMTGKCDYFSYPNGMISKSTIEAVKKNHKMAFTCSTEFVALNCNPFLVPRVFVSRNENMASFKAKMCGLDIYISKVIKHGNQGDKHIK